MMPDWPELMVSCAASAWGMADGGNQWSGWVSLLSFFRHVAQLPLDYTKWNHYEQAATLGGPRYIHKEFCIVSERPEVLTVDAQNRPHNETGPFCRWRDGSALYAWHGTRVPAWVIEHPGRITADHITREANAEVRRVMLERMGADRYIAAIGAQPVDQSDYGRLYRVEIPDDEPVVMVRLENSTPEPDGTSKEYWLRVPPTITRAREAVAWTFGMDESEYAPAAQS